jgi:hypothetical protein
MCFKCKAEIGKHLHNTFSIQNSFKEGDALLQWFFNFALGYVIRHVQIKGEGLKLTGSHQLLGYHNDINLFSTKHILERKTQSMT